MNTKAKILLQQNSKLPVNKWSDKANWILERPKNSTNNIGIITGKVNNIIVVDIDVKDEGLEEWQLYVKQHGNPNTYTVKTPSGGLHYYFTYISADENDNYLIENYLKNSTKFRGKGIDIRSNGGYIVMPPSIINNVRYDVINDVEQIPMSNT